MRRRGIALLTFAAVLWALESWGMPSDQALQQLGKEAGLGEDVTLVIRHVPSPVYMNGIFQPPAAGCEKECEVCPAVCPPAVLTLYTGEAVPDAIIEHVLLHEIGHYHQWRADSGGFEQERIRDSAGFERQSDAYAVEWQCEHGINGRQVMEQAFQWATEKLHYHGDPLHGLPADRIAYVKQHSPACDVLQAPLASD